ncbi:hypothetical protein C8N37_106152 [Sphingobacterium faecium]|nr:hypothetical protein C8N37_106152 [Sphingobacterium faecium]
MPLPSLAVFKSIKKGKAHYPIAPIRTKSFAAFFLKIGYIPLHISHSFPNFSARPLSLAYYNQVIHLCIFHRQPVKRAAKMKMRSTPTKPPIKKMNERFPPKGTPIKSFFFLVCAIAHFRFLLSFFRFFFWKNEKRSKASHQKGKTKKE